MSTLPKNHRAEHYQKLKTVLIGSYLPIPERLKGLHDYAPEMTATEITPLRNSGLQYRTETDLYRQTLLDEMHRELTNIVYKAVLKEGVGDDRPLSKREQAYADKQLFKQEYHCVFSDVKPAVPGMMWEHDFAPTARYKPNL